MKDTVVSKEMGGFYPAEAKDDRIDQCKNYLGDRVMIVALGKKDMPAKESFQPQSLQKEVKEIDAAKVSNVLSGEGSFEIFGSKAHLTVT